MAKPITQLMDDIILQSLELMYQQNRYVRTETVPTRRALRAALHNAGYDEYLYRVDRRNNDPATALIYCKQTEED